MIWSFISGSISRLTAYAIAKDETVSFSEVFGYVWKYKWSLFLTPFILTFLIFIFGYINWGLGYLAQLVPAAGPILFIGVLICTLLMIFLLTVLFLGFHLINANIGVDGCDGLEAVISAW